MNKAKRGMERRRVVSVRGDVQDVLLPRSRPISREEMARMRVKAPRKSMRRSLESQCVESMGGRCRTRVTIREARRVRGNWIMNALNVLVTVLHLFRMFGVREHCSNVTASGER